MEVLKKYSKVIIFILIVFICAFVLIFFHIKHQNLNTGFYDYGIISNVEDNLVTVSFAEKDDLVINSIDRYKKGSYVAVYKNKKNYHIEVIGDKKDIYNNLTSNIITSTSTTSSSTKANNSHKSTESTTKKVINEKNILNYVEGVYKVNDDTVDASLKDNMKKYFIRIVDFIFYDETINGIKFDDLLNDTKAKVLYYTLLIDQKIDKKFPGYKSELSDKYTDITSKIFAKYMDISTSICSKNDSACEQVKTDLTILKKSLNISWNFIKNTFKYGYDKSSEYLKKWYELFSGKI